MDNVVEPSNSYESVRNQEESVGDRDKSVRERGESSREKGESVRERGESVREQEEWSFLPEEGESSSSDDPALHSSCEFVNVVRDPDCILYHRKPPGYDDREARRVTTADTDAEGMGDGAANAAAGVSSSSINLDDSADSSKDEELRRLMDILQARVKSSSPSHSNSSDSDYVHISGAEPADPMEGSSHSSAGSRFNIVVNSIDQYNYPADIDNPRQIDPEADFLAPDADDRAESDILQNAIIAEGHNSEHSDDEEAPHHLIRQYRHSPNRDLNTVLTGLALTALGFAIGIAIGHSFGSAREAALQEQIQEGQRLRLRAVQDDLLMCLRKQEDIDQTINKLNEIENILVDAEHWRNEYEELLNIKLQNEEAWRTDKANLQSHVQQLDKDHTELVRSKSCAHDNEFLSRQETTLKSVHEKLEANLLEKDRLIEQLQSQASDCRVTLVSGEKIAEAYRKSNEEKSILILQLKGQLLQLEREAFDMKVSSEPQEPATAELNPLEPAVTAELNPVGPALTAELNPVESVVTAELNPVESAVPVEKRSTQIEQGDNSEDSVLSSSSSEAVTIQQQTEELEFLQLQNLQLQLEVDELKRNIIKLNSTCQRVLSSRKTSKTTAGNETIPCVVFNLCDKFSINMTSSQVLKFYTATKSKYDDVQSYLAAEWKNFTERLVNDGVASTDDLGKENHSSSWDRYVSSSQKKVSQFMDVMNDTWMDIKHMSDTLVDPGISKTISNIEKKVSKNFEKLTKTINKGLNAVKTKVTDRFSSTDGVRSGRDTHTETAEPVYNNNNKKGRHAHTASKPEEILESKQRKANKKFESRRNKLRDELEKLDAWRVDRMKRYEREDYLEEFDDLKDDYAYLFNDPDLQWAGTWVDCQLAWWQNRLNDKGPEMLEDGDCADHLMSWQGTPRNERSKQTIQPASEEDSNQVDGTWLFHRAEDRQYHRDKPDDWFWRRTDSTGLGAGEIPYPNDEL